MGDATTTLTDAGGPINQFLHGGIEVVVRTSVDDFPALSQRLPLLRA